MSGTKIHWSRGAGLACTPGCGKDHSDKDATRCGHYWSHGANGRVCTRTAAHCGPHVDRVHNSQTPR